VGVGVMLTIEGWNSEDGIPVKVAGAGKTL
jgi:hypothetical protein